MEQNIMIQITKAIEEAAKAAGLTPETGMVAGGNGLPKFVVECKDGDKKAFTADLAAIMAVFNENAPSMGEEAAMESALAPIRGALEKLKKEPGKKAETAEAIPANEGDVACTEGKGGAMDPLDEMMLAAFKSSVVKIIEDEGYTAKPDHEFNVDGKRIEVVWCIDEDEAVEEFNINEIFEDYARRQGETEGFSPKAKEEALQAVHDRLCEYQAAKEAREVENDGREDVPFTDDANAWDKVKDKLFVALFRLGDEATEDAVRFPYHGLTAAVMLDNGDAAPSAVRYGELKRYGVSELTLIAQALSSMQENHPAKVITMAELLRLDGCYACGFSALLETIPAFAITNSHGWYGASAVLQPGILEEAEKKAGGSYYLCPYRQDAFLVWPVSCDGGTKGVPEKLMMAAEAIGHQYGFDGKPLGVVLMYHDGIVVKASEG